MNHRICPAKCWAGSMWLISLVFWPVGLLAYDWSDPSTWSAGDAIVIPAGQSVTLDRSTPELASVTIHGSLDFVDQPIELIVGRIIVAPGGALLIGTTDAPHQSEAIITLTEADQGDDGMGNRVLGVMDGGLLSLHGARPDPSWTQLARDAMPGQTQVALLEAVDWKEGDQIVIAASGFHAGEAEKLTVVAVDGNSVAFQPALEFIHLGHVKLIDERPLDVQAEVGLLTRNIRIQSPSSSEADEFGFHAMFMAGSLIQIDGVELMRGGQIAKPGRYPAHWHGVNDPTASSLGSYLRNSAIHRSFQRGVVTHDVNGVLVENNVVYDVWSHAFVPSESGTETGNRYLNNLAVLYKRRPNEDFSFPRDDHTESDQAEHRPAGFWLRNYHNELVGNHAAGGEQGIGFFFDSRVMGHHELKAIYQDERPIVFRDNLAHSHYRQLSGGGIPTYGPKTRTSGLMVTRYAGKGKDVIFERFSAYKNALAGVWIENRHHTLRDSILADSSMAIFNHQASIENVVAIQQTDNLIGGENQVVGNRKYLGGGMHFQGFAYGGDNPRVDNVTFVGFRPAAFAMWKDVLDQSPWPRVSNLRLIDTPGFWYLGNDGTSLLDSRLIDLDGTVSGTGQLTYIGGSSIASSAQYWPEFNAYVAVVAASDDLFGDSFE